VRFAWGLGVFEDVGHIDEFTHCFDWEMIRITININRES
jgi:hypothetical protein